MGTWHHVVAEGDAVGDGEVMAVDKERKVKGLGMVCPGTNGEFEVVEFSSEVPFSSPNPPRPPPKDHDST